MEEGKTGNVFLNKLKMSKIYQSILGFVVVVVLICLFSGNDYVEGMKGAIFEIDKTRTLEQAFRDNPYVKSVEWEAVEFGNGRVGVWAKCEFNADFLIDKIKDDMNKEMSLDAISAVARIPVVLLANAYTKSYLFMYDESGDGVTIDRVKIDLSRDKLQNAIKRFKERMKGGKLTEKDINEIVEPYNAVESSSSEITKDKEVLQMLKDIYEKELP